MTLTKACEVDVMPGDNDISGAFLPQQPANVSLLPQLLKNDGVVFWTNPHKFEIKGMKFLGSSGQNIDDISRFIDMKDKTQIDIMNLTLEMRHLAPTWPDTLRSFPFEESDPLILENSPNVYFSCNSKGFETKVESGIRLITVPAFTQTKELVLVDAETLEAYSYQIQSPSFA